MAPSDDRPWGRITVIDNGDGFQVKRLEVRPGRRLSLQVHRRRSEHWYVVHGVATATVGPAEVDLPAGNSIDIAVGERHRLANHGDTDVVIVEVGRGDYLGEDDIERFDDDFGRV
ncbi:hypothetical protein BH20ACT6_BH20ACT6_13320 [soil metagenome]